MQEEKLFVKNRAIWFWRYLIELIFFHALKIAYAELEVETHELVQSRKLIE